jgi:hypothetical protein
MRGSAVRCGCASGPRIAIFVVEAIGGRRGGPGSTVEVAVCGAKWAWQGVFAPKAVILCGRGGAGRSGVGGAGAGRLAAWARCR